MSWFFPFSDSWKKRACRYLLQRYLGQFLEEKLTLDQLSVDLYNGTGSVCDVCLDVQGLNELAEQQNLPVEFVDGYIGQMSVSIPWATILRDSSYVQISGMVITIQPKQRTEEMGTGSLFESMISMTSSIQLATEIQQTEPPDPGEPEQSQQQVGQAIEGIELIAKTLDSILCKIKVKFVDTIIRLEHVPKQSKSGVALEIHIKNMDYCDEAGCDINNEHESISSPNAESAFAIKKFHLDGVSLYTDEFPTTARTVSRPLVNSSSNSPSESPSEHANSPTKDTSSEEKKSFDPVLFGKLVGRQELRVKVKQSEGIPGPKVDLELNMGSFLIFSTPRQIHLLQELFHGLATPGIQDSSNVITKEKRMAKADFERVGLDLLNQLHPGAAAQKENKTLHNMQGWSAADPDEDSDEEFHPIGGSLSRGGSLTSSMDSSTMSTVSGLSKSASIDLSCMTSRSSYIRNGKRKKHRGSSSDPEPGSNRNIYQIRLSSLAIVLVHEDILTVSVDTGSVVPSSVLQLNTVASDFFNKLALFAIAPHGNKDFQNAKQVFLNACQLNHLRLLAAPVILELDERDNILSGVLTGGSVELLECLVEEKRSEIDVEEAHKVQYVELLKFMRDDDEKTDPLPKHPLTHQPDIKIKIKQCKKSSRSSCNSIDISLHLEQCWTEVDISIMDRISALLNPKPLCTRPEEFKAYNTMQSCFDQAIETCSESENKLEWKISSAYLVIKLRFPIPDLRPLHDLSRSPWWKYRVHDDILFLQLSDISVRSHVTSRQPAQSFELQCRSALALFQEGGTDVTIPFGYTSFHDGSLLSNDYIQDLGWPRLVIRMYSSLNYDLDLELEDPLEEPQCMAQSFMEPPVREPSPFTYRKVFHNGVSNDESNVQYDGEELVIPGDKQEISNFIDDLCRKAHIQVDIQLPSAYVQFPNKHLYELIYNRLTSDLLLWTPSAPSSQTFTSNVNINYNNVFSMCKRSNDDTDSDAESQDDNGGIFYSTYDYKPRTQRNVPQETFVGQSKVTLSLRVSQCVVDFYPDVKDENGVLVDGEFGQVLMICEDVNLFTVSKYKGNTGQSFVVAQVSNASLHHSNKVQMKADLFSNSSLQFPPSCDDLVASIYKSAESSIASGNFQPVDCGSDSPDMLTVVVHTYIDDRQLKMNQVSCSLRGATLRHRMSAPYQSIYSQLIDFFDVIDYPVIGYEPLPIIVEYHQHFFDCAIDYRPLHLPYSALVSLGSFSISCNLAAQTTSSTLRFIAEDISLFISNKKIQRTVDLKQDYVCVIEIGLFELSVRVSENKNQPHLDLKASNNVVHIRTCSDSARALLQLLAYLGSDGDLKENKDLSSHLETQSNGSSTSSLPILDNQSDDPQRINNLMEDAMTETVPKRTRCKNNSTSEQVEVFLFPDEGNVNETDEDPVTEEDDYLDKEFCFLEPEAGSGCIFQTREPEIHIFTTSPIKLCDNHFALPLGKTDLLQPPKHFPMPVQRYTLRETTIVWHIYGGSDFGDESDSCPSSPGCRSYRNNSMDSTVSFSTNKISGSKEVTFNSRRESVESLNSFKNSPKQFSNSLPIRWQEKGGPCRQHDVKIQLQLNKLRFQHDVYPESSTQASRQVILIHDVEIRDRLASSNINKFLYAYSSNARPRQSHAHMVVIKALHLKNELGEEETCLKVALLPLRLNIDQDAILFLFTFATQLTGIPDDKDQISDSMLLGSDSSISSPVYSPSSKSKEDRKSPIFIKSFVFSPEVLIRLDYQGKHVDMSHGPLAGILMGLAQLNCSEIRLKRINHRHGLLGFNKLISFVQQEWSQDIYKNQLPSLLGGVGPMYSLVQLAQGIKDLFWLPIEQYQKDGRIVRGLQRGANSFTTSTAMAALELTARIVLAIQTVAETAFDIVSPGPSVKRHRNNSNKKRERQSQPMDIREGVSNALTLMREGLGETAQTLLRVASEEHEAKGAVGAVGGVLRQIPQTAIKPIILASKATSNVLGGVKSQLVPDARKEAAHKWRTDDL